MKTSFLLSRVLPVSLLIAGSQLQGETKPPKNLDTPRDFPSITSREQWLQRAQDIREHVSVSCGLYPMPKKTPLNAHVFGKIERDGYSIEKVYFLSFPGFYVAGNLYRPLSQGKGPFPAILNPHGHWSNGRMADTKDGSIAARCISFARQGMIAFSYDMVGFNDTHFADSPTNRPFYEVHRLFATDETDLLWNISLMGLQTWNSLRAVDFLESLPDADTKRLACTGESGGGTQTFMLGAIEERLAAQAPVVMVSHIMQGGCLCENAPGLRVEYSNMEIAAAAAPRPQILVAATGDWTKDTPKVEGPSIEHIYRLLGAPEKFHYVQFDFGHNYNQTSREAVYEWFGKWLPQQPATTPYKETNYQKELDENLRVFPDGQLPPGALTQGQFIESLRDLHRSEWNALVPRDKESLNRFQKVMRPAWQHTLQLEEHQGEAVVQSEKLVTSGDRFAASVTFRRAGEDVAVLATYWAPPDILTQRGPRLVIVAGAEETSSKGQGAPKPSGLTEAILQKGIAVLAVNGYSSAEPSDQFTNFYCTYNRTKLQSRVRDLLTVCASTETIDPRGPIPFRVALAGTGSAGLWALLAAPGAEAVAADAASVNSEGERALLAPDVFCPGLLAMGGFEAGPMLVPTHPLLVHNTGEGFTTRGIQAAYKVADASAKLRLLSTQVGDREIAEWLARLK
jgi:dienelactone hydrolase